MVEPVEVIGLIGAGLVLLSWIFETVKEIRKHKSLIDFQFSVIAIVGSIFLTYYSYLIANAIFFWLSLVVTAMIAFEIVFSIHLLRDRRR